MEVERVYGLNALACILFFGYTATIYIRQSVTFAAPVIAQAEKFQNSDIGLILSSQMVGYTLIKLTGGPLSDIFSPAYVFISSLLLTGVVTLLFTLFTTVETLAFFWFLNGVAQGPSWGALAVILRKKFPNDSLGTWWSIMSLSANVAGAGGPFLSHFFVSNYGWRSSFYFSGFVILIIGSISLMYVVTRPIVESSEIASGSQNRGSIEKNYRQLVNLLLLNTCVLYLFTSFVRGSFVDWGQMYLLQSKQQSLLVGSTFISSQETGGIVGSFIAGAVSDNLIHKSPTRKDIRLLVVCVLSLIETISVVMFTFTLSSSSTTLWVSTLSFFVGFGMYGIIALLGIASMDAAPIELSGTANSMGSLGGNIGRILAGYPLSLFATRYSWDEGFQIVCLISASSILIALFTYHLSYKHHTSLPTTEQKKMD